VTDAFYIPAGEGAYDSTGLTRGPWNPDHQHAGPPAALLARAIEQASAIDGGQTVRLSYDILGPVPVERLAIATRTLRGGRRVEQLEATLANAAGGAVMRATAWRMRTADTAELAPEPDRAPPPPDSGYESRFAFWPAEVAYHRALDWRWIEGDIDAPGPATVWTRLKVPLVAGEDPAPLQRLLVMADAASGASAELDWQKWLFVNVELGIHLERPPSGEWMAMDARTRIGPAGAGLCTSVLFDGRGRVGQSTQSLLVAERS
jgi:hypothetical protein